MVVNWTPRLASLVLGGEPGAVGTNEVYGAQVNMVRSTRVDPDTARRRRLRCELTLTVTVVLHTECS